MNSTEDPREEGPAPQHRDSSPATYAPQTMQYPMYPAYYASPPPPPKRWVWFLLGAASTFAIGIVVVVFGAIAFFLVDSDVTDMEYEVDQSSVIDAVEGPCNDMQDAADDVIFVGGADEAALSMAEFTASVRAVVEAVEGASPNEGARAWRDDLETMAASLDAYASRPPAEYGTPFRMPRDGGEAISDRMYYGSPFGCEVPVRIETLDPGLAAEYA